MGNSQSTLIRSPSIPQMEYENIEHVSIPRTGKEKTLGDSSKFHEITEINDVERQRTLKTAFAGIWSLKYPNGLTPQPRTGQFYAKNERKNAVYVGFGMNELGEVLTDLWCLSLSERRWEKIQISGCSISPRSGASACFIGNSDLLLIFGGFANKTFFSDMYLINVETGEVNQINCNGNLPEKRANAYISNYGS